MNTSQHEKWLSDRKQKLSRERSHRGVRILSSLAATVAMGVWIVGMVQLGFYAVLVPALLLIWVSAFAGSALAGEGGAYARAAALAGHYRWTCGEREKVHRYWAAEWLSTTPVLWLLLSIMSQGGKDGDHQSHQPSIHEIVPLMAVDLPDLARLGTDVNYASRSFHRSVRRGTFLTAALAVFFAAIAAAANLTILYAFALVVLTAVLAWVLARVYHGWTVGGYMAAYRYLAAFCSPDSTGGATTAADLAALTTEGRP